MKGLMYNFIHTGSQIQMFYIQNEAQDVCQGATNIKYT